MVIDGFTFTGRQCARTHGQVFHLISRQKFSLHAIRIAPHIGRTNVPNPLLVCLRHGLRPEVDLAQEITVLLQRSDFLATLRLQVGLRGHILHRAQGKLCPQRRNFLVPLEHFKTRVQQIDPVKQGLQLGRLVHHMHRCGHLSTIVQQAGDLEFIAVPVIHDEIRQRSGLRCIHRVGQHHRQGRHALAMASGVMGLLVDSQIDNADERLKQLFHLSDQVATGDGDGSLRCERLHQALIRCRKWHDFIGARLAGVDQLEHANHLAIVVIHRHGQERP